MGGSGFFGLLIILGIIVAVLWVFLPFAVFGIKDLAKSLIQEQQKTNALLTTLMSEMAAKTREQERALAYKSGSLIQAEKGAIEPIGNPPF